MDVEACQTNGLLLALEVSALYIVIKVTHKQDKFSLNQLYMYALSVKMSNALQW